VLGLCAVLLTAAVITSQESINLQSLDDVDVQAISLLQNSGDVQLLHDWLGDATSAAAGSAPMAKGQDATPRPDGGGTGSAKPISKQPQRVPEGGDKKDVPMNEREAHKKAVLQNIDMESPLPLSLAGQSGYDTQCTVKGNSVEVSGRAESACLFSAPIIKDSPFDVEIVFDVSFNPVPEGDNGRHGGIFYGARQNIDTRAGNPTVDWIESKTSQGYRVYGNKDTNKVKGMSPGPKPNTRWQILIHSDGRASFTAGPKTWLKDFSPQIQGPYIGFWCAAGNKVKFSNVSIRKVDPPKIKAEKKPEAMGKVITASPGYGKGEAILFYSATGGSEGKVAPKAMYLKGSRREPRDFRTKSSQMGGGDVAASESLVAGRFLKVQATQGFGSGFGSYASSGRIFYIGEGRGSLQDDSLYVADGGFGTQIGSMAAKLDVIADKRLALKARTGFGTGQSTFAYVNAGKAKRVGNTMYLQSGNIATQDGSAVSSSDVTAAEYLVIKAKSRYGDGEARFWFSRVGKGAVESNTVYLKAANLHTQGGSIMSQADIKIGRHLKIGAMPLYGDGVAKMFYIGDGSGKYSSNTLYATNSFGSQTGSVVSKKNVATNRWLKIGAFPGFGSGSANLWYCHRAALSDSVQKGLADTSLYLGRGDFSTQTGSIFAKVDVIAKNMLSVRPTGNSQIDPNAQAQLWYSHRGRGRLEGESLYVKGGNFGTKQGSIVSSSNLIAAKYVEIGALEGYGAKQDKIQLYYSAKLESGAALSTLYQKAGDFRLQQGSIHSKDLSAGRHISIQAKDEAGDESASLWYVDVPLGKQPFRGKSLYVKDKVDFHSRNVYAAKHLIAKKRVLVHPMKGFGNGPAELWFGKSGGAAGALSKKNVAPDTMYLRDGHFNTEAGGMKAALDVVTKEGQLKIAPRQDFRSGTKINDYGQLFYVAASNGGLAKNSLFVKSGDFRTLQGSIASEQDIRAQQKDGTLKAKKAQVQSTMRCDKCNFGKIYIMPRPVVKSPSGRPGNDKEPHTHEQPLHNMPSEALVLLDEGPSPKSRAIDVEAALRGLQKQHQQLSAEEAKLRTLLGLAKQQITSLETLRGV